MNHLQSIKIFRFNRCINDSTQTSLIFQETKNNAPLTDTQHQLLNSAAELHENYFLQLFYANILDLSAPAKSLEI